MCIKLISFAEYWQIESFAKITKKQRSVLYLGHGNQKQAQIPQILLSYNINAKYFIKFSFFMQWTANYVVYIIEKSLGTVKNATKLFL